MNIDPSVCGLMEGKMLFMGSWPATWYRKNHEHSVAQAWGLTRHAVVFMTPRAGRLKDVCQSNSKCAFKKSDLAVKHCIQSMAVLPCVTH